MSMHPPENFHLLQVRLFPLLRFLLDDLGFQSILLPGSEERFEGMRLPRFLGRGRGSAVAFLTKDRD